MVCENCTKEHDGSYGSGRFCCKKCARSYSTKHIKGQCKEAICIKCGKSLLIDKRASIKKCICDNCKYYYNTCNICGKLFKTLSKNKKTCESEFCNKHGIQQFASLIKYFGFDKAKLGTKDVEIEFNRIRNLLYDLYWNKHLSSTEICKIYNYPSISNLIAKVFTYLEIPHKTLSECTKENLFFNRLNIPISNQYKQQWHTTWNNKKVYLRSSYELAYAIELDKLQIDYEVENLRITYWDSLQKDYRIAIPDFYLKDENMIVEIKSSYTLDIQNMRDKKQAYLNLGYQFKCICDFKEIEI